MAYGMPVQTDPTNVMGKRILAYLIDALLTTSVLIAVLALTKKNAYTGAPTDACRTLRDTTSFSGSCVQLGSRVYTWDGGGIGFAYLVAGAVSLANNVVLQGITGASIGKMILGLRVVNAQGATCGIGRAFLRWIFLVIDSICLVVGLIVASVTHPHRRVGDMVAGTYVVGLASVGQPMPGTAPQQQYQYAYGAQPGAPEWAPPGSAPPPAPGWGTTPPPAWGAAPPATQPPTWGAPPAAAPPAWGEPPPPPPAWGTPPPPPPAAEPSAWGAPPPAAPAPEPSAWGAPPEPTPSAPPPAPAPPAPTAAPPQDRSGWGTPPSTWAAPTPEPPAPTPPPPAPPAEQSAWGQPAAPPPPQPAPAPPAATPPAPEPPAPEPAAEADSAEGESWWNKAFGDDEPK